MTICIVCSLSVEEECRKTTEILNLLGFDVVTPFGIQESQSLYLIQKQYLNIIESCDIVLVLPKYFVHNNSEQRHRVTEDYSIMDFVVGESVSYEIAYARKIGKPIIFGMLPFVEEKEEKKDVSGDDEVLCERSIFREGMEEESV